MSIAGASSLASPDTVPTRRQGSANWRGLLAGAQPLSCLTAFLIVIAKGGAAPAELGRQLFGLRRPVTSGCTYAGERDRRAPTLEEIQRLVGERAPEPVPVSDPTWLATFRCQRRSTHVYRRGPVMLAGDAVHIHSPAGGQG